MWKEKFGQATLIALGAELIIIGQLLKASCSGVPPDWFLPAPIGLRGPLENVRLSLRPPLLWKLP